MLDNVEIVGSPPIWANHAIKRENNIILKLYTITSYNNNNLSYSRFIDCVFCSVGRLESQCRPSKWQKWHTYYIIIDYLTVWPESDLRPVQFKNSFLFILLRYPCVNYPGQLMMTRSPELYIYPALSRIHLLKPRTVLVSSSPRPEGRCHALLLYYTRRPTAIPPHPEPQSSFY